MARVLIVDDDLCVLALVESCLRRRTNCEVIAADNPEDALEIACKEPPCDLVISDVQMPGIPGPQLIQEITQFSPRTVCILMSGCNRNSEVLPPNIPFLQKPFGPGELMATVRQALLRRSESDPIDL